VYVSHLSLTNFRNYHRLDLDVPAGLLTLSGGNAQGKSNLLEAVYLLSIAKAYRANSDREAICRTALEDRDHAQVLSIVQRGQDRVRIMVDMRLEASAGEGGQPYLRKDIMVNGIHVPASDLVGVVNAVLFDAEDIQLVSGPPATRRRYLDILICQLDRTYLRALQRYQKVVYQRNHLLRLLRERRAQPRELDFWNEAIVQDGVYITLRRHQVVQELRHLVNELHCELTEAQEELTVDYVPSIPQEGMEKEDIHRSFERTLEDGREREVALGTSQWGPHRDDLRLMVGGMEAANYASRGQARTLAVTLKLAEGTLLERERGEPPILLLDDVLSELDASRRHRLLEYVSRSQQAIISTTDLDRIEEPFLARASKFLVEKGNIKPL
jgi:DNA replication and repair protein RecF